MKRKKKVPINADPLVCTDCRDGSGFTLYGIFKPRKKLYILCDNCGYVDVYSKKTFQKADEPIHRKIGKRILKLTDEQMDKIEKGIDKDRGKK